MPKFNERLKLLRVELGLSQQSLAAQIGTSKSSINMYERGEREPGIETLERIADYFNVDMDFLIGKAEHKNKLAWLDGLDNNSDTSAILSSGMSFTNIFPLEIKSFPMLGEVACGEPVLAEQSFDGYVMAGANIKADFCLKAKGNSMINARIYDGDIVFIRRQADVENGEIAVVCVDNEATLKRIYKYKNRIELRPENPLFPVLEYENDSLDKMRILGKAVAFQSDVR